MMSITGSQALIIASWFLLAVVVLFISLIARLLWIVNSRRTYFMAYLLPIVLFGVASARDAFIGSDNGDPLASMCWALGGLLLIVLVTHLSRQMRRAAPKPPTETAP